MREGPQWFANWLAMTDEVRELIWQRIELREKNGVRA